MKKVMKKLNANIEMTEVGTDWTSGAYTKFEVTVPCMLDFDCVNNAEFYVEVEEPESLKEWLEETGIPKKQLLDWLKKHYK